MAIYFYVIKLSKRYIMKIKAIYKNDTLKPLEKLNLKEGEEVEISIKSVSLANEFQGVLKLHDPEMIEEIAESDELI